jgi:hypothetical protein
MIGAFGGLSQDRLDTMCLFYSKLCWTINLSKTRLKLAFIQPFSFGEMALALCA